jgi:micrococcal nuclease
MYEYNARLIRIVDGDTVWLRVDLGFRTWIESDFRLHGINAPEVHGATREAGLAAAAYLRERLTGKVLRIESKGLDKYGRWLAIIHADGNELSINRLLMDAGHAVPFMESKSTTGSTA